MPKMQRVFDIIERDREQLIKSIQQSIAFKSVQATAAPDAPFGAENRKALEHALALAATMGFTTKNLNGYCGYAEFGVGCEYIAVLGHLDIVALGEGWTAPPLEGRIVDNAIVGRGSSDNKGPLMAALYAAKALKEADIPLKHRIRVIFGCNEESGMKDMEYYSSHEPAPLYGFTPDGSFPVVYGEKGGISPFFSMKITDCGCCNYIESIHGGETMNIVPAAAQAIVVTENAAKIAHEAKAAGLQANVQGKRVEITAHGQAAHASSPQKGDNAITKLIAFLAPLGFSGSVARFVKTINKIIGREVHGQSLGIGYEDEDSGKLTLNLARIRCENGRVCVGCDVRIPVTIKPETAEAVVQKTASAHGLDMSIAKYTQPLYFPRDCFLVKKLNEIFCKHYGRDLPPITMGGGTYAKKLPNTVAFGMGFPDGKSGREHNCDENLDIDELMLGAKIIAEGMATLAAE